MSSIKTQIDIISWPPKFIFTPTMANYVKVFGEQNFLKYFYQFYNYWVAAIGASLLLGLPAAYAIARFKLYTFSVIILLARIMPGISF